MRNLLSPRVLTVLLLIAACAAAPESASSPSPEREPAAAAAEVEAPQATDAKGQAVDARAAAAGDWKGAIELPGQKLEVHVTLALDSSFVWTGTISIPAQGAKDLKLVDVAIEDTHAKFRIDAVPGEPTFDGTLEGAKIAGKFTQSGQSFPFTLERAADPTVEAADALAGFDEWLEATRAAWKTPAVAVAIVHGGKTVHAKACGLADVDAARAATPDTLFAIGSSTKAFTTFVLGTLVDEGKLAWDDRVRKHLPEFRLANEALAAELTVRDLVTHRSGLPRHDLVWYNSSDSRAELVARMAHLEASADVRTEFQYNNLMFITAGLLAEHVAKKTWEELVRERVFTPLAMQRSNFSVAELARDPDHAEPYDLVDDAPHHKHMRAIDAAGPAGSINSSVNEMAQWVALQLGDGKHGDRQLIQTSTLTSIHTVAMPMGGVSPAAPELVPVGYGLGWMIDVYRGHLRIHHGGNIDGYSALVVLLPQDDWGMVILTNQNASPLPTLVARHATDRLLGLERTDWSAKALTQKAEGEAKEKEAVESKKAERKTGTSPSHPLADYVGEFEHPGYGVIAITLDGDALAVELHALKGKLEHWHYDVFSTLKNPEEPVLDDSKLQFTMDFEGEIDGLRTLVEPTLPPMKFARRAEAALRDPKFLERYVGDYDISGQLCQVRIQGEQLTVFLPGQPTYTLDPKRRDVFALRTLEGFSLKFVPDESGKIVAAEFHQPNGVFKATRKE